MKPPVALNPALVAGISALFMIGALLPIGESPHEAFVPAAAAETPPDAAWSEPDYLLHYAKVVCLRAAYGALQPAPSQVLEALDTEAWAMVDLGRQKPGTYQAIHTAAWQAGDSQTPERALAGCDVWVKDAEVSLLEGAEGLY